MYWLSKSGPARISNSTNVHERKVSVSEEFLVWNADPEDSNFNWSCETLFENNNCYTSHWNDVGKASFPFRIGPKFEANLKMQRPTQDPFHCREKLFAPRIGLQRNRVVQQISSTLHEKTIVWNYFFEFFDQYLKFDGIKNVFHAQNPNLT